MKDERYDMMKKIYLICLGLWLTMGLQAQRLDNVTQHTPYIVAVDEYRPAPGQFVNMMPKYEQGDDAARMAQKCTESLANNQRDMVCLGGYGGYITFHFDHSIANVQGQADVLILGNSNFEGNSEPGIVMVSKDENGNGLPDDTWYELKGSADADSVGKVVYGYTITYQRPTTEQADGKTSTISKDITIEQYVPWTDNQGQSGYVSKNRYHAQTYYPMWVNDDTMTFGPHTLLPRNAHNTLVYPKENWILQPLAWGYVDNKPNADLEACSFNFDNAVEVVSRQPVVIDFVDFIRVYNAINQDCGWIGETSTEVTGAEDLHLDTSIQRVKDSLAGIRTLQTAPRSGDDCYDLQGRKTHAVGKGLYIRNGKKYFVK
jgi:hypothetical protein